METEKKFSLILAFTIGNAFLTVFITTAQFTARADTVARFKDLQLFHESVMQYRKTAEQLEKERWDNLLRRVDQLDKKIFEHQLEQDKK